MKKRARCRESVCDQECITIPLSLLGDDMRCLFQVLSPLCRAPVGCSDGIWWHSMECGLHMKLGLQYVNMEQRRHYIIPTLFLFAYPVVSPELV